MTSKISWWSRASTKQKLAQIDGGISLGMTAKQVAKNVRVDAASTVQAFANRHGRHFPTTPQERGRRGFAKMVQTHGIANARRWGVPDSEISSAFTIFDAPPSDRPFIDEVLA